MNPPRLVLEVGGTSTKQAAMPGELKSPPTWNLEVGGTSTLQAQLPARLKSPPLQAQVWGGSRWADLAVNQTMQGPTSVGVWASSDWMSYNGQGVFSGECGDGR